MQRSRGECVCTRERERKREATSTCMTHSSSLHPLYNVLFMSHSHFRLTVREFKLNSELRFSQTILLLLLFVSTTDSSIHILKLYCCRINTRCKFYAKFSQMEIKSIRSPCAVKLCTQTLIHTQSRRTVFDVLAKVNSDRLEEGVWHLNIPVCSSADHRKQVKQRRHETTRQHEN